MRKYAIFLSLILAFSSANPARAADATDPAWEKFTSARRVFQMRLAELAAQRWPKYVDFFVAHRDLQLRYMDRRTVVFYYLLKNEPARIVRNQGGQVFMNFAWDKSEEKSFDEKIPGFSRLSSVIAKLETKTKNFKNRATLKDKFARLEIDPDYLGLCVTRATRLEKQKRSSPALFRNENPSQADSASPHSKCPRGRQKKRLRNLFCKKTCRTCESTFTAGPPAAQGISGLP
jgi:hypothetical protein